MFAVLVLVFGFFVFCLCDYGLLFGLLVFALDLVVGVSSLLFD